MKPDNFDIVIETKTSSTISLRFFSNSKADLWIKDVKFFYSKYDFISSMPKSFAVTLDNSYEIR